MCENDPYYMYLYMSMSYACHLVYACTCAKGTMLEYCEGIVTEYRSSMADSPFLMQRGRYIHVHALKVDYFTAVESCSCLL